MEYGLYEVVPGHIYQVRGFDLANISFIRSDTGWIVFDPLTATETAAAALALVNEHLGARPVVAVVYSHSHGDHFAGAHGVVDEADVRSGKVPVIAPVGFLEHAVAENVYAGNAMNRRMFYQYGSLLDRSPFGHVDQAIGKGVAAGTDRASSRPPIDIVDDIEELTVDGVRMVFQNTPGTEAPAEMNTWFPDSQGVLGGGEHRRDDPQHLHPPRCAGPRCTGVVAADQQGALPVRPRGRGHVRVALLAAVGQRAHPGGHAHAARHVRAPEQRRDAPGEPGRHDQRDPPRLPGAGDPSAQLGGAQLPRVGGAQLARRHQPLPRLLGRQPRHAHPADTRASPRPCSSR